MISVLFVCLGNICRSPMAEVVFNHIINKNGFENNFLVDSAGLIDIHEGEKADYRMRTHAEKRNYCITHLSRPIKTADFEHFDYIIAMDDQNIRQLNKLITNKEQVSKIHKASDFCSIIKDTRVPDPYYGTDADFEYVIDILEDACEGLFHFIDNNQRVFI